MIAKPTVLVLGAGSSTHVGNPLGTQLVNEICKPLINKSQRPNFPRLPDGWDPKTVEALVIRLSRSGHASIDAFLEGANESERRIGKYLIAHCLKEKEDVFRLFPPNDSGWYQYLFRCLLVDDKPWQDENRLSIITFNYDRSVESYLHEALQARFNLSAGEANEHLNQLPILHLHGQLGRYPDEPFKTSCEPSSVLAISEGIKIIHEVESSDGNPFPSDDFSRANQLLREAERMIFLGFGFHSDNVSRLGISAEMLRGKEVFSTTAGMQPRDYEETVSRMSTFGFTRQHLPHNHQPCNGIFSSVTGLV